VRAEVLDAGAARFLVKGADFDRLADVVVELAS
jgi:predicted ribosome-associated RNA-binding protein Tma20